jgi:hypothetical protein
MTKTRNACCRKNVRGISREIPGQDTRQSWEWRVRVPVALGPLQRGHHNDAGTNTVTRIAKLFGTRAAGIH